MFWKLIGLLLACWGIAFWFDWTLGGAIHLIPVGVAVCLLVRRVAKDPKTEFGRWRAPSDRGARR
jgi:hypothetical protein